MREHVKEDTADTYFSVDDRRTTSLKDGLPGDFGEVEIDRRRQRPL
jgi:hypothetical protein